MERVFLCYNDKADYLFEIDNIENLDRAIEYKNKKLEQEEPNFWMSDFDYILEYLDQNAIQYNYIDLFNVQRIEY